MKHVSFRNKYWHTTLSTSRESSPKSLRKPSGKSSPAGSRLSINTSLFLRNWLLNFYILCALCAAFYLSPAEKSPRRHGGKANASVQVRKRLRHFCTPLITLTFLTTLCAQAAGLMKSTQIHILLFEFKKRRINLCKEQEFNGLTDIPYQLSAYCVAHVEWSEFPKTRLRVAFGGILKWLLFQMGQRFLSLRFPAAWRRSVLPLGWFHNELVKLGDKDVSWMAVGTCEEEKMKRLHADSVTRLLVNLCLLRAFYVFLLLLFVFPAISLLVFAGGRIYEVLSCFLKKLWNYIFFFLENVLSFICSYTINEPFPLKQPPITNSSLHTEAIFPERFRGIIANYKSSAGQWSPWNWCAFTSKQWRCLMRGLVMS